MVTAFDLVVIGAGPAGISAALTAARAGLHVLLAERLGFAGGMATGALVNPFLGNFYRDPDSGRTGDLMQGVFADVLARLRARGAAERFFFKPGCQFYDAFDDAWLRIQAAAKQYGAQAHEAGWRELRAGRATNLPS